MIDWKNGLALVTGAKGFLGKHVCRYLREVKHARVKECDHRDCDLTDIHQVEEFFLCEGPIELVLHLAGVNGGLSFNLAAPSSIFVPNVQMAMNVLELAYHAGAKRVLSVVASCAYGDSEDGICREEDFLRGQPHPSTACHGNAKRVIQLASSYFRKEKDFPCQTVCPTTLYGPGMCVDPTNAKVVGGLIQKFVTAADNGLDQVACWGTGDSFREFLYVEDAARMIVEAAERYDDSTMPLNLGSGQELRIKELAKLIADLAGFHGKIVWVGEDGPGNGQYRKRLDLTRMYKVLGRQEFVPLSEGIERTVRWYRQTKSN